MNDITFSSAVIMKLCKKLSLLFGSLILFSMSFCQQSDIPIERVEGEGLTNYYVKAITQDKKGFLWFGTEEGLFRYDGYKFQALKHFPGDPNTILNDNIEFLLPDKNGFLWVGSRGGLSLVNSSSLAIKNFPAKQPMTLYSLVAKDDSSFYAGTSNGLFEFSKSSGQWKIVPGFTQKVFIRSLTPDGNGHLIITSHDGIFRYNISKQTTDRFEIPVPKNQQGPVSQIAHRSILSKDGNVWISTWNSGLIYFEPATGKLTPYYTPNLDKTLEQYRGGYDLFQDSIGNIWMANSENGISYFDLTHHTSSSLRMQWEEEKSISDRVYALFKDKSGTTWIGTENGIFKRDPNSVHFSTVNFLPGPNTKMLRPDLTVLSSLRDKDGLWWIGTYEGLFLLNPITGVLRDCSDITGIPKGTNVFNLFEDSLGTIWATNRFRLVCLKKKKNNGMLAFTVKVYEDPSIQSNIQSAYLDRNRRLWLGTHKNGVYMFEPSTETFKHYKGDSASMKLDDQQINCFYELPDQSVLTGGERTGLIRILPESNTYQRVFGFDSVGKNYTINSIALDDQHRLWIGTEGYGLWRMNEQLNIFKQYSIHDGLPSMNIRSLLPLPNDNLWLISEGGVVDFRLSREKLTIFDKDDGLRNLYNLSFITKTDDSHIAIGDMGCMHFYNTAAAVKSLPAPEIIITGFKVFDKPYPVSGVTNIELNYDQNYFSFEYVGLIYTKSSYNMYEYMLEGLDKNWHEVETRRYVSYANLEEGDYTFKVKACNVEGTWNDIPATLRFTIKPPYWHRWWFYLLVIVSVALIIYLVYYIKQHQVKSREQLRNKIARDLHDDIGSTLSGINIFSKIALQKLQSDPASSGELLQRINRRTEKTMEALSDIVWSINTRKDNMDNVFSRMREYLGEVIEPLGIRYEFLTEGGISNVHIDMEIRKEVYLIFKEAVHNASKYAGCSFIRILFRKQHKSILLSIEDDGKGFDIQSIVPGNGINNMQERAEKIRGKIDVKSEMYKGTIITLVFPIT